ncbi:Hpt domain-containing protein [Phenylobacterium sp.]|uniref:Hpt domain-containing protein n=1 Tax=Phenylobacterium sp. TaxID=1871053 RepID=UPI002DF66597|nr:Hpt domain-containing protein [Phenylobacterium sp.]
MAESGAGAVDFDYLERFAAGDRGVVGEVLSLFLDQARIWAPRLTAEDPGWRDVAHTIKGAGRGIGANRLGDVCAEAEAEGEAMLPKVREALAQAVAAIEAYQARA